MNGLIIMLSETNVAPKASVDGMGLEIKRLVIDLYTLMIFFGKCKYSATVCKGCFQQGSSQATGINASYETRAQQKLFSVQQRGSRRATAT